MTELITGYAIGKLLDAFGGNFREKVIERWSKRRAQCFFMSFCHELELGIESSTAENIQVMLDIIFKDDEKTEVLFDAYRQVCLSKSKKLGPRVIGIIAARIIIENRIASDFEESMFLVAEELSDDELLEFAKNILEWSQRASSKDKEICYNYGCLEYRWWQERIDSNSWFRGSDVSIAPLNFTEAIGKWALKLKNIGVLVEDIKERQWDYEADCERKVDMPGTIREISWYLYIDEDFSLLAEIINLANEVN